MAEFKGAGTCPYGQYDKSTSASADIAQDRHQFIGLRENPCTAPPGASYELGPDNNPKRSVTIASSASE